jgi:hypothetical protein
LRHFARDGLYIGWIVKYGLYIYQRRSVDPLVEQPCATVDMCLAVKGGREATQRRYNACFVGFAANNLGGKSAKKSLSARPS